MGSDSDLKVMSKAAVMLEELGIEYEMTIISAHREPDELIEWTRGAESRGIKVANRGQMGYDGEESQTGREDALCGMYCCWRPAWQATSC